MNVLQQTIGAMAAAQEGKLEVPERVISDINTWYEYGEYRKNEAEDVYLAKILARMWLLRTVGGSPRGLWSGQHEWWVWAEKYARAWWRVCEALQGEVEDKWWAEVKHRLETGWRKA